MSKKLARLFILPLYLLTLPFFLSASAGDTVLQGVPVPLPSALSAAEEKSSSSSGYYLTPSSLDLSAVPAAPAPGSRADLEDFETIFAWQQYRTAAQCAAAREEMSHNFQVFFGAIDPFYDDQAPEVKSFFKNVEKDSTAAHRYLKDVYRRDRPFLRDARVKPCLPRVKGYAYPSGHTTMARLFARILSDLVPSRAAEFMARADEAALNRLIGGVHHPTDLQAGKALADALYAELRALPSFNSDMDALRAHLR
ncbi:MAG: acid phosphatase (class A) [Elusimicrobia bacterium]|nr:MAG: acid phosphatase (class A) [Elusimicrobiota bacterium]KAF0153166.1 MAG: acid phosphatase (class A) [Elusimicrobiota bacterium]